MRPSVRCRGYGEGSRQHGRVPAVLRTERRPGGRLRPGPRVTEGAGDGSWKSRSALRIGRRCPAPDCGE
ncbi:hypothetical protein NDU88_006457 [Pleurodeles waltl]|uniref:Uncharacterized protein n=1 Tax=Pleurodeles waltl TaxID=8319 RepID=A0AAV7LQS2_PLEWA|nr:hypothetical protein NDU88_006457 [Pleurodeles waltl]